MIVVLGVLFEHSVHSCLHGTVLTHPYISVSEIQVSDSFLNHLPFSGLGRRSL